MDQEHSQQIEGRDRSIQHHQDNRTGNKGAQLLQVTERLKVAA